MTDGNGSASTSLPLNNIHSLTQSNVWLDVHESSPYGVSVACGLLQVNDNLLTNLNTPSTGTTLGTNPTTSPNNVPSSLSNSDTPTATGQSSPNGFPNTGAAPDNSSSSNGMFPRKY